MMSEPEVGGMRQDTFTHWQSNNYKIANINNVSNFMQKQTKTQKMRPK